MIPAPVDLPPLNRALLRQIRRHPYPWRWAIVDGNRKIVTEFLVFTRSANQNDAWAINAAPRLMEALAEILGRIARTRPGLRSVQEDGQALADIECMVTATLEAWHP